MKTSEISVLVVIILLNIIFWTYPNLPAYLVNPPATIDSLSFNPYQIDQSPLAGQHPTDEQLDRDLQIISTLTNTVRIYGSDPWMSSIPGLAKKYGIDVVASAWIDSNLENNKVRLEQAIQLAGFNKNVKRLIVGNETQLSKLIDRGEIISREDLISLLAEARKRLKTPVSTAEPWDYWLKDPELASEVDFIAIHVLPYWVEVPIDQAIDYVVGKYRAVKNKFPNKFVYLAEVGWPSDGPQRGPAEATLVNQARFVREFAKRAKEENIPYNLVEAFDQPWKGQIEGRVGEHWGIWDAHRQLKFPIEGSVIEDTKWKTWAFSSSFIGFFVGFILLLQKRKLKLQGKVLMLVVVQLVTTGALLLIQAAAGEYLSRAEIIFWTIMITFQFVVATIFLSDSNEVADVIGHKPLHKIYPPHATDPGIDAPFVSIHLACCNEPPAMVNLTIDSLTALDYPNFEVIVVDNNTKDPALWEPVKKHCEELGSRVKFFSLGKWPGYKAGAVNFALKKTDPRAQVVGVVDADYIVDKRWLNATIPYFADPNVAVVQCPQEHRNWENNIYLRMENDGYTGFFRIGMVQRNEDNAIIQHGTMTLVNRKMLDDLNGWSEWNITEDSELGLRLLLNGKRCIYINECLGRGLVPDNFEACAKQLFRWAFGGMRIFRHYIGYFLGLKKGLSIKQRYQFIKGWLGWFGDFLHMIFTGMAITWSSILLSDPQFTEFPRNVFVYPAIALVLIKIFGTLLTYRVRVPISRKRTLLAMMAFGAITHTIAKATFQALFTRMEKPFLRTPKMAAGQPLVKSLLFVWQETVLMLTLWTLAFLIAHTFSLKNKDAILWIVALLIQSFPYVCAVVVSVISALAVQGKKQK